MRGEHIVEALLTLLPQGSSPHARGTRVLQRRNVQVSGIIPACAGNTRLNCLSVVLMRDHPRMRGEHFGG